MVQDITVVVPVSGQDYRARLLNDGSVRIYLGEALAGAGTWDDGRIHARAPSLASSVYDVIESALAAQLEPSR